MQTVGISNSPSQGIALVSGIILFSCLANLHSFPKVRILDYSFVILLLVLLRRVSDKQPTLPTVFLSCSLIEKQLKTLQKPFWAWRKKATATLRCCCSTMHMATRMEMSGHCWYASGHASALAGRHAA